MFVSFFQQMFLRADKAMPSAAASPTDGRAPAPNPSVTFTPIWIFVEAFDCCKACASVFATTNSTPTFTENAGAVGLFSGTSVDAIEAGDLIDTLTVTVDGLADGSDEILVVDSLSTDRTVELARKHRRFDLIIASMQVGDMDAVELAQRVEQAGLGIPVIMLAFNHRELIDFAARRDLRPV